MPKDSCQRVCFLCTAKDMALIIMPFMEIAFDLIGPISHPSNKGHTHEDKKKRIFHKKDKSIAVVT